MGTKPLTILLGEEVYSHTDVVSSLVGAGHTVKCIHLEEDHLIFSTRAWRLPGDGKQMPDEEMLKHLDTAIKQTRAIQYVQDKKAKAQPERPTAVAKPAAKGKRTRVRAAAKPAIEANTTTDTTDSKHKVELVLHDEKSTPKSSSIHNTESNNQ